MEDDQEGQEEHGSEVQGVMQKAALPESVRDAIESLILTEALIMKFQEWFLSS